MNFSGKVQDSTRPNTFNVDASIRERFLEYPGNRCIQLLGPLPLIIQLPFRAALISISFMLVVCIYMPVFFWMWIAAQFHRFFSPEAWPIVEHNQPEKYYSNGTEPVFLDRHSRRVFSYLALHLLQESERGLIWKCVHHFVQAITYIDFILNTVPPDSRWTQEMRNEFGNCIPLAGTLAFLDYDAGERLLCGIEATRNASMLAGVESNSVLQTQSKGTPSRMSVDNPQYKALRGLYTIIIEDGLERLRSLVEDRRDDVVYQYLTELADPTRTNWEDDKKRVIYQAMFYLLTGIKMEEDVLEANLLNKYPFFGEYTEFLMCGWLYLFRAADAIHKTNKAVLQCPRLVNKVLRYCEKEGIDPVIGLNQITRIITTAGSAEVITKLGDNIMYLLNQNTVKYVELFAQNPMNFVKEAARVMPPFKTFTQLTREDWDCRSGGLRVRLPRGDRIIVLLTGLNTSYKKYKSFSMRFEDNHVRSNMYNEKYMVSWAGREEKFRRENPVAGDPRGCPGHDWSQLLLLFLMQQYAPENPKESFELREQLMSIPSQIKSMAFTALKLINTLRDFPILCKALGGYEMAFLIASKSSSAAWNGVSRHGQMVREPFITESGAKATPTAVDVQIPKRTEDGPVTNLVEWLSEFALERLFPVGQSFTYVMWDRPEEGFEFFQRFMFPDFPLEEECPFGQHFQNTDDEFTIVNFLGCGSTFLKKEERHGRDVFVSDLTKMYDYEVFSEFKRYGARAEWDANKRLTRIYVSYLERDITPDDGEWQHAKFVHGATLSCYLALGPHLGVTHLKLGNYLVKSCYDHLPPDDPLRLLLRPTTYRVPDNNLRAKYFLFSASGVAVRTFGLTPEDMTKYCEMEIDTAQLKTIEEMIRDNNMMSETGLEDGKNESDGVDFVLSDGLEYEKIVRDFVREYCGNHYKDWQEVDERAGKFFMEFCAKMGRWSDFCDLETDEERYTFFVTLLTAIIVHSTGIHKLWGVLHYARMSPYMGYSRFRAGQVQQDVQSYVMQIGLEMATTVPQVRLLTEWDHLYVRDQDRGAVQTFMARLKNYSDKIKRKNLKRRKQFGFECPFFDPALMECSISI